MSLPRDLVEMLSAFAAHGVRYLVIDGHAVSLHAHPRTTKDLDLWLDPTPENITRACAALVRFGVPTELVAALRSAAPEEIVWMGRSPARVDFLQRAPGGARGSVAAPNGHRSWTNGNLVHRARRSDREQSPKREARQPLTSNLYATKMVAWRQ